MSDKKEDKLLFKQIKQGRKEAFDSLFRKYYEQLVRFSIGYVKSGQIAEELVQDVFIRFWEYANRINIESSLLAYLYTSSRNACLNYLKSESIRRKHENEQQALLMEEFQRSDSNIDVDKFKKLLSLEVGNLPQKCRQIFELSKFEGLSYDEISTFLNISPKTVENQMGIALRKLREAMTPYKEMIYD